ncbi:hypothetical protein [Kangiella marina]|uniref:Carboxypeptidase regulatory-like domain-containing protein n=1 Tax=Kangiella marina TaxID=1079178 RepID=A0ABP8IHA9_9GAMM
MYKKFFEGLLFGAGFTISMLLIWTLYTHYQIERTIRSVNQQLEDNINSRSEVDISNNRYIQRVEDNDRFFGSSARYVYPFDSDEAGDTSLPEGPGVLKGLVTTDGEGVSGVRIRLALNQFEYSPWAETSSEGVYEVKLPYGNYNINGYQLGRGNTHRVLSGAINKPGNFFNSKVVQVEKGKPERGLDLAFVSTVKKVLKRKEFERSQDVILEWDKYPGAERYSIEILKNKRQNKIEFEKVLPTHDLDRNITNISLTDLDLNLEPGYYVYNIKAFDASGQLISTSGQKYLGFDFRIKEV